MSDETDKDDKPYEASQKKLDDARAKGELAKSTDLMTAAGYVGLMVAFATMGGAMLLSTGAALQPLLEFPAELSATWMATPSSPFMATLMTETAADLWPVAVLPGLFALTSAIAQRGLVFAPTKLAPKASRISLIKGFANKFGRAGLFEFFKSFAKLLLFSLGLGLFLWVRLPEILGLVLLTPRLVTIAMVQISVELFAVVIVIALAIGLLDYVFQRNEHLRKNRMSRKELTDEQKQSEGDPLMKQQRRGKAIGIAMNQMLADVPQADVIMVNPTHYAVALKWDRGSGKAPVCVAKGVDHIASRIRQIGADAAIAIHHDPETTRAIHATVELGEQIHPSHYKAVAAAIRFAETMKKKARKS